MKELHRMSGSGVVRELNRSRLAQAGYQAASAALTNEQLTRQRVERLEAVLSRGLWGRIVWLLRGK
jgi:IS30 family transposase